MRIIIFILVMCFSSYSFSLTQEIPKDTKYFVLKVDKKLNQLAYHLTSPAFKFIIYPSGEMNESPIVKIISFLKNYKIKNIEIMNNDQWGVVIKISHIPIKIVSKKLISLLNEEGFSAQEKIESNSKITLASTNPEFQGNQFYIESIQNDIFISTDPKAVNAIQKSSNPIPYYKDIEKILSQNILGFTYINNQETDHNPYFMTFNYPKSSKILVNLYQPKDKLHSNKKIQAPSFFIDKPLIFLSWDKQKGLISNLFNKFMPIKSLENALSLLTKNHSYNFISFILNRGNIYSVNEKKYNMLNMAFAIDYTNINKIKNKIVKLKNAKKLSNSIYKLYYPKDPLSSVFLLFCEQNKKVILSLNLDLIKQLNQNIIAQKKLLNINGHQENLHRIINFIDIHSIIDKFAVMPSFFNQYGMNINQVNSIIGYNNQILPNSSLKMNQFEIQLN